MTSNRPAAVIVLAAGGGTRMRSATPKVLHRIGGRTLLAHALVAARGVQPEHVVVVVRHDRDRVAAHVAELDPAAVVADQDEVAGTGRAAECGLAALPAELTGTVLVTMGDAPLLTAETLQQLADGHADRRQPGHPHHREPRRPHGATAGCCATRRATSSTWSRSATPARSSAG